MPSKMPVLAPAPEGPAKKLLALDLDETLVHSSFQVRFPCDFSYVHLQCS
jgi:TFIIF-interacting CTD phosphatase-like protein